MSQKSVKGYTHHFAHLFARRGSALEFFGLKQLRFDINTLDERGRGLGGMYLSVTGTSAESGDSGQVGRGNKVNGVIALNRPMGTEAAAGKNPTHARAMLREAEDRLVRLRESRAVLVRGERAQSGNDEDG